MCLVCVVCMWKLVQGITLELDAVLLYDVRVLSLEDSMQVQQHTNVHVRIGQ